ncbi:ABC transporter permease [Symbioplanes lichenis]|uniref:ABC transporter permease n=1 Tax=Symbioplanes lichenis TaxID=1629072 RepID=UPI0027389807|nr:ABC transporter permease [Actinoplanes lichenis]
MLTLAPFAGSGYRPGLLLALPVLMLLAFGFTALGVLIAVCIRRPEAFQIVAGLCLMPLLFLSGAVLPAQGLPGWLSGAVLANPLTYGVDALRRTLPGDAEVVSPAWAGWVPPVAVEIAVLGLLAVLALGVATARFARPE